MCEKWRSFSYLALVELKVVWIELSQTLPVRATIDCSPLAIFLSLRELSAEMLHFENIYNAMCAAFDRSSDQGSATLISHVVGDVEKLPCSRRLDAPQPADCTIGANNDEKCVVPVSIILCWLGRGLDCVKNQAEGSKCVDLAGGTWQTNKHWLQSR
jgi:hypothetical protein